MNLYRYDMHVHTIEVSACAKVNATEAVRMYKEAGYTGIVITDHYCESFFKPLGTTSWESKIEKYLEGYRIARSEGTKLGLNVMLGIEICFTENHNDYLIYGIDEAYLKQNKELFKLGIKGFRELTRGTDIMIYQAHPYRPWMIRAKPVYLDGVEVYNGNPRHNSHNEKALAFAKKHSLKMISGSDFHQPEDLARGGILLSKPAESSVELFDILRNDQISGLIQNG